MLSLAEIISKEIEEYPLEIKKQFKIEFLHIEITKQCTSLCPHCMTYGSPQAREKLTLELFKDLIDQAVHSGYRAISMFGGEPFLHKEFLAMLSYALQKNLTVAVTTNAFWATSKQAVQKFVEYCLPLLKGSQKFYVGISWDKFHREYGVTPIQNVVNLIEVLEKYNAWFDYEVRSVDIVGDKSFTELLALLPEQIAQECKRRHDLFPLELAVGRVKDISPDEAISVYPDDINNTGPIIYAHNVCAGRATLFIAVTGDVVLDENLIGDKILPVGNIKDITLEEIEKKLNQSKFFKLLYFLPLQYFFYPFRKYLDLQELPAKIANAKIRNTALIREEVSRVLQAKGKQFDRSAELRQARAVYLDKLNSAQAEKYLSVIEHYGDLSDVFYLRHLVANTQNEQIKQKAQQLLNGVYWLDDTERPVKSTENIPLA